MICQFCKETIGKTTIKKCHCMFCGVTGNKKIQSIVIAFGNSAQEAYTKYVLTCAKCKRAHITTTYSLNDNAIRALGEGLYT